MASRIDLQKQLETIMGSRNVYFQPPESVKMTYPCIRYELNDVDTIHADNAPWRSRRCYQLTLIAKDPDNNYVQALLNLPETKFDRYYGADNLHHWCFRIYY